VVDGDVEHAVEGADGLDHSGIELVDRRVLVW